MPTVPQMEARSGRTPFFNFSFEALLSVTLLSWFLAADLHAEARSADSAAPSFSVETSAVESGAGSIDAKTERLPGNPNFVPPVCIDPDRPCRDYSIEFCRQYIPPYNCRVVVIPIDHPLLRGHLLNIVRKPMPGGATRYCLVEPQANIEIECWSDSMHPSFDEMWIPKRVLEALCKIYEESDLGWKCTEPIKHWIWTPEWFIDHCYPEYEQVEHCKGSQPGPFSSQLRPR